MLVGVIAACMAPVNLIPAPLLPFVILAVGLALIFYFVLLRLSYLRCDEAELLKMKADRETEVLRQQQLLMAAKQEATAWQSDMKRLLDGGRALASKQIATLESLASSVPLTATPTTTEG